MTIDIDVARISKRFGVDARLIQSVVNAEGNILRAVQCSIPSVTTRDEALEITCRSCAHAMSDWIHANGQEKFIAFWAQRWAPQGAANDPHNLNANWPKNVLAGWVKA